MNYWRHAFQIDLVHDAIARRYDLNVLERFFRPVDEMEAIFVAAVFNGPVFFESVGVKPTALNSQ